MLIGTLLMLSSRRVAVTTISRIAPESAGLSGSVALVGVEPAEAAQSESSASPVTTMSRMAASREQGFGINGPL
jgi:hypothetical protein